MQKSAVIMPEDKPSDDPLILILAELKSLNRTLKLLAAHPMDHDAPPRRPVDGTIPPMSDDLPRILPEPIMRRLREMEPGRREHLLSELRRAWDGY